LKFSILFSSGFEAAMDLTRLMTRSYIGEHIFEEIQGIADGAEVDAGTLMQLHLYTGLAEGYSSIFGAWGGATPDGSVLQMNALDWDPSSPLRDHQAIVVRHPAIGKGQPFINIGFLGFVGSFCGASLRRHFY
jgi:hypothetical protein